MNKMLLYIIIAFIMAHRGFSCVIKKHKKAVFDLIPFNNRQRLQETELDKKMIETRSNLKRSVHQLWNQYNGNWIGVNGHISILHSLINNINS